MIRETIEKLVRHEDLSRDEAARLMDAVVSGRLTDTQIAGFAIALRAKGETVDEIAGFVTTLRERALRVTPTRNTLVDTCGTGGDGTHTFNISTAAAFVAAGAGVHIAKHGNRALSSRCGSTDVLEALGIQSVPPGRVAEVIDRTGIGFMFAPAHHPALRHAANARRELGVRTVFNLLGPMANPAFVKRQLVGVFDPAHDRDGGARTGVARLGARVRGARLGRKRRGHHRRRDPRHHAARRAHRDVNLHPRIGGTRARQPEGAHRWNAG